MSRPLTLKLIIVEHISVYLVNTGFEREDTVHKPVYELVTFSKL